MHTQRLASLALCLACCGESRPLKPDSTTFEVTWKPATVQVPASAVKEKDASDGKLTLASTPGVQTGAVVVVADVGIFKVTDVTNSGSDLEVKVTPAALTDAIQDGKIAWSRTFGKKDGTVATGLGKLKQSLTGSYEDGTLTFEGNVGSWPVSFSLTPQGDGYDMKMQGKYENGAGQINLAGSGHIAGFTSEADITIEGGSVTDFTFFHDNLEGDFTFEIGSVAIEGAKTVEIPAKIVIPLALGPVPAYLELGGQLQVEVKLGAQTSMIAKAKYKFTGSTGFSFKGGKLEKLGTMQHDLAWENSETVSTITAGFGAIMDFPRVDVGLGVPGTGVSAYVTVRNELVTNVEVFYESAGGFPVITGQCVRGNVNQGGYLGGSFQAFGLTVAATETQLFAKVNPPVEKGEKCGK